MKDTRMKTPCPKCRAMGHFGSATLNERGEGDVSVECDLCKGEGEISKRYFVEFTFTHIDRTYWMPIFFEANTDQEAIISPKKFEIGLKDKYTYVEKTKPILYDFENESIISDSLSKYKKIGTLSVSTWKLKIKYDDSLSFAQNIYKYVSSDNRYLGRLAIRDRENIFAVHLVRENQLTSSHIDYLSIDIKGSNH